VAKTEWGTKRTCRGCGEPFYDLNKKEIKCPKCGDTFNPNPPARPKRSAPAAKAIAQDVSQIEGEGVKAVAKIDEDGIDSAAVDPDDDDDKDDDLIEDTSDLISDDDDVSEVIEHVDDATEDKS